jgi:hypothetical protein
MISETSFSGARAYNFLIARLKQIGYKCIVFGLDAQLFGELSMAGQAIAYNFYNGIFITGS